MFDQQGFFCPLSKIGISYKVRRAINRSKLDRKTNIELVEVMWEQFHDLETYEVNVIDTTNLSVKDTVLKVKERITTRTALLH